MSFSLNNIKSRLVRLICTVHRQHPEITIVGTNLNFKCCCEEFRSECLQESKKEFAEEAKKSLTESFNKAFKKFK